MRKRIKPQSTRLEVNKSVEGICMEENVRSIIEGKTGISQQFEAIYTDRADGVLPQFDIRTDRFEIAREAKDKLNKFEASKIAKGENKGEVPEEGKKSIESPENGQKSNTGESA